MCVSVCGLTGVVLTVCTTTWVSVWPTAQMSVTVWSLIAPAVTSRVLAVRRPSVAASAATTAAGTTPRPRPTAVDPSSLTTSCRKLEPTHLLMESPVGSLPMGSPIDASK